MLFPSTLTEQRSLLHSPSMPDQTVLKNGASQYVYRLPLEKHDSGDMNCVCTMMQSINDDCHCRCLLSPQILATTCKQDLAASAKHDKHRQTCTLTARPCSSSTACKLLRSNNTIDSSINRQFQLLLLYVLATGNNGSISWNQEQGGPNPGPSLECISDR